MTARDKTLFKWFPLLIFLFGGLFFYVIPFLWGSIVAPAVKPGITTVAEADRIVQTIITEHLPPWFSIFVVMGVVAAAVSTAAVQLMTSGVIVARDIVQGVFKPDADDGTITSWARYSVVIIIVLSMAVSVWQTQAMALYLTDVSIPGFAQWAPALVGGLFWKRGTKQGAIAGTLAGVIYLALGLVFTVEGKRVLLLNLHPVMPTLLLNTIIYIVVSKLTPPPSEAIQEQFFEEVDAFLRAEGSR
jgi:SSS family solute:Na+ symporter